MVDTAPTTQLLVPCAPWTPPTSMMPLTPTSPVATSTPSSPVPTSTPSSPATPVTPVTHHRQTSSWCTALSDCSFHSAQEFWEVTNLGDVLEGTPDVQAHEGGRLHSRSRSVESLLPWGNGPSRGRGPLEGEVTGLPAPALSLTSKSAKGFAVVPPLDLRQIASRKGLGDAQRLPVVPPLQLQGLNSANCKETMSAEVSKGPTGFRTCQNQLFVANPEVSFDSTDLSHCEPQAAPTQLHQRSKKIAPPIQTVSNELFVEDQDVLPSSAGSEVRDLPFRDARTVKVSLAKRSVTKIAKMACMCACPNDCQDTSLWEGVHWGGKKTKGRSRSSRRRAQRIPVRVHRRTLATIHERGDECPEGESLSASLPYATRPAVGRKAAGDVHAEIWGKDLKMKSLCPSIPGTDTSKFTAHGPNASWVDEKFFDCSEAWEVMLAPFDTARGTDKWSQEHDVLNNLTQTSLKTDKGAPRVVPLRPQRPHQQKASVEDLTPVYIPLSTRGGADIMNGDWVGSLSARKVRLPGLADVPRQDELGHGLKSLEELIATCTGIWQRIPEESDDPAPLCDVMELPWIFKHALSMATQTEVAVDEEQVLVKPKLFGMTVQTAATPWTREGVMVPRRDRRKGMSRICLVRTTFGFRQYNCWADPYAGMSIVEIGVHDDGKLLMSTFVKRRSGPSCKIRTCMIKV